ncbi:hypothetical protein EV363DRAFT_75793 [Boletus edulis]|nr:hypothetical protein EV363DRAFT_75793 [Boletus edulis]
MTAPYTHPPPPPPSHMPTQPFTTILLPPPTPADTLNIHEYRPPPVKEPDPKRQNSSNSNISFSSNARSRAHSHSASPPNPNPNGSPPPHHVNSNTPAPPPPPAPYVNASAAPAVPATFANIMNAYPPQPSVREEPQVHSRSRSREASARRLVLPCSCFHAIVVPPYSSYNTFLFLVGVFGFWSVHYRLSSIVSLVSLTTIGISMTILHNYYGFPGIILLL